MEPNMDIDIDLYDVDDYYTNTDHFSQSEQMGAPSAHSQEFAHDMEPSELANLINAANASKDMRARLPRQSRHNSGETYPNNHRFMESVPNSHHFVEIDPAQHQFMEADPNKHQLNQAFLDGHRINNTDLNNPQLNRLSNNLQSNKAYVNNDNPQFNETNSNNYHFSEACPHDQHPVDATPSIEETDTLSDELPNFKRRKTEHAESSHTAMTHEHAFGTTSTARTSMASVSTGGSSRFSSSTACSSFVSTSTGRSSVASTISSPTLANQPGEEGAYQYKCLICHMGEGSSRKVYTRKKGNTSAATRHKKSWNSQNGLEKHIREDHIFMFQRTNSSEYVCFFCPCGDVTEQDCEGRFLDKNALLNHVATAHHEVPNVRPRYHHFCAPVNLRSYSQKLFDKWTRRNSSGSD